MSYYRRNGSKEPIPGGVQCPVCGLWFKNERALSSHMKVHKYKRADEEQTVNIPNPTTEQNPTQQQPTPNMTPQQSLPMQMVQDPNSMPLPFGVQSPPQIPGQGSNWLMNLMYYAGMRLIDKYLGSGGGDKMMEFLMNLAFDSLKWRLGIADAVLNNFAKSILKNPDIIAKYLSGELGSQSTSGCGEQ